MLSSVVTLAIEERYAQVEKFQVPLYLFLAAHSRLPVSSARCIPTSSDKLPSPTDFRRD